MGVAWRSPAPMFTESHSKSDLSAALTFPLNVGDWAVEVDDWTPHNCVPRTSESFKFGHAPGSAEQKAPPVNKFVRTPSDDEYVLKLQRAAFLSLEEAKT